jgi:hypothetical protein
MTDLQRQRKQLLNHQKNLLQDLGRIAWRNYHRLPESVKFEMKNIAAEYNKAVNEDYPKLSLEIRKESDNSYKRKAK